VIDFHIIFTIVALNAFVLGVVFFVAFLFDDLVNSPGKDAVKSPGKGGKSE
jgi:hypothetical protein